MSRYFRKAALLAAMTTMLISGTIYAESEGTVPPPPPPAPQANSGAGDNVPSSLDADEIIYDMRTNVMSATGNVLMTHGTAKLTGREAELNLNTNAGFVVGDVIAVSEDMRLTADKCTSDGNHMVAEGDVVHATKKDKTYSGPRVDYFHEEEYVLMEQGGEITSTAGEVFSANRMEGWTKLNYARGTGDAHLISPPNKLEASGDVVDYYGKVEGSNEPAKAYLTGNAWAVQDNNTLRSKRLVVYLAEETGEAKAEEADEVKAEEAAE